MSDLGNKYQAVPQSSDPFILAEAATRHLRRARSGRLCYDAVCHFARIAISEKTSGNQRRTQHGTFQETTLTAHRRRLKRRGVVRLEVNVRKDDVPLVRGVVKALDDPERQAEARLLLRERFGVAKPTGFKALLAAARLEGIDLTRERDGGLGGRGFLRLLDEAGFSASS